MDKPIYGAIATGGKQYKVAELSRFEGWKPIGDFRSFDTFEEADKVARECSKGNYNRHSGDYINMR